MIIDEKGYKKLFGEVVEIKCFFGKAMLSFANHYFHLAIIVLY